MELAITGATGFIGSHVVDAALASGYRVRILVRSDSAGMIPAWKFKGVHVYQGDIRDASSLAPFLTGADALCHVAGVNTPTSRQKDNILSSNVDGTRLILQTAKKAGVKKIVYTGSAAALGSSRKGAMNNENTPFNLWNASTDYERSKYLGEKTALDLCARENVPVVIVQPSACVGPGDVKPTYTGKLILDFINRRLPGYFDIRNNFVDVRAVARGHLLALEKGCIGQRYLLCGDDNILLSEFFGMITEYTGVPAPRLKLPLWMVFPLAYACQFGWHLFRIDPFIRVSTVKRAWLNMHYDNSKAKSQLGFAPPSVRIALRDELQWMLDRGMLDRRQITLQS